MAFVLFVVAPLLVATFTTVAVLETIAAGDTCSAIVQALVGSTFTGMVFAAGAFLASL